MKADYQLRHQLYGRQGSLWEYQVDDATRTRFRRVVKEAGNAPTLADLDQMAAGALNSDDVEAEDTFFRFSDGNFAVVGQLQRDYTFRTGTLDDGTRLHVAYRGGAASTSSSAVPTQIALITNDFLRSIDAADGTFSTDRDWYLIPIPFNLTPLVIEGRDEDVFLVNGVDFTARHGYIAMTDDPSRVLPQGLVRVSSAKVKVSSPNSFVLSAPTDRRGNRYLAEYAYKTQSLSAFKKAAAEYAGLFVAQEPDVVLDARETAEGVWVYSLANAGAVEIGYEHDHLSLRQELPPGFIVSGKFDVVTSRYNEGVNLKQLAASNWDKGIRLDGILPVNGLTWDGQSQVAVDSVADTGGTPHLRLHFDGDSAVLERFWEFQRLHEQETGVFLYDELGATTTSFTIDFWDILETFFGTQLCLVLMADHSPVINVRMWQFLTEHRPQSCNLLLGLDLGVDESTLYKDSQGIPLLDEYGNYYTGSGVLAEDLYYRPGGVSVFYRPDGDSFYLVPA